MHLERHGALHGAYLVRAPKADELVTDDERLPAGGRDESWHVVLLLLDLRCRVEVGRAAGRGLPDGAERAPERPVPPLDGVPEPEPLARDVELGSEVLRTTVRPG